MNYITATIKLPQVAEADGNKIFTPSDVFNMCADLRTLAQESFQILTMDTKYFIINRHMITLGLLNGTMYHPREVFRAAILDGADSIIAMHNHPSGDPNPSAEDVKMTKQLAGASKIIGIEMLDHVIIGRNTFYSFRENGQI